MKQKKAQKPKTPTAPNPAPPEVVMAAAEKAPRVFSIGAYFRPIYLMREKGHTWRYLADWLKKFNINVSHVHLHRLYLAEDERLDRLSREELETLGMPEQMIEERLRSSGPRKRIPLVGPEDLDPVEDQKHEP